MWTLGCEVVLLLVNRLIGAACRWRAEKRHTAAVRAWVFASPHSDYLGGSCEQDVNQLMSEDHSKC